jgi:glycosyltransferase involved in cell wall biosynthesis
LHYVGPIYGPDRAAYFKLGLAMLMPGLVGLAIVDSFVTQAPIFTTDLPLHSPEIAYLENGINGVMTDFTVEAYADAVAAYLEDGVAQEKLKRGCAESARLYTLENMVGNFAAGIKSCLAVK